MSVIEFLPALLAGGVEIRAVGDDNIVAAVGRGIPDWFVLSHEEDGDTGGQAPEGGGCDLQGGCGGERADGGEGVVGGGC